jgi:hypothetical protein
MVVSYYEVPAGGLGISQAGWRDDALVCVGGLSKFSSFTALSRLPDIDLPNYDYIMFLDDDIVLPFRDVDRLFQSAADLGLHLAQPALDSRSYGSWEITRQAGGCFLRLTNFVEIMAPIMSAHALKTCVGTFDESVSGWGLDLVWPKLLNYPIDKIGIFDAFPMTHTKPIDPNGGRFYVYLRSINIDPHAEMVSLVQRYRLQHHEVVPKVHAVISM